MANVNLMQRRRSDGTLCLMGSTHSPEDEDRVFPEEFDFSFKSLGSGTYPATVEGDKITLTYANAKAVYKIVGGLRAYEHPLKGEEPSGKYAEYPASGHHAVLESAEYFDAPPLDRDKRDALIAGIPVVAEAEKIVAAAAADQKDKG